MVFSVESTRALISKADASDNTSNARDESVRVPYRVTTELFAGSSVPFDVVIFPDGETAPDRVDVAALERFATVVLPDCWSLTPGQAAALAAYLDARRRGGRHRPVRRQPARGQRERGCWLTPAFGGLRWTT